MQKKPAYRILLQVLRAATQIPKIRKMGPPPTIMEWGVDLSLIGARKMRELNLHYKGKNYATDILSFPATPTIFKQGFLGELVVCTSVLKRQAKEQKHSEALELKVLLAHGLLHLLQMDHEKGKAHARQMALLESAVLKRLAAKNPGLIARSQRAKF